MNGNIREVVQNDISGKSLESAGGRLEGENLSIFCDSARRDERKDTNVSAHINKHVPRSQESVEKGSFGGLEVFTIKHATEIAVEMKPDAHSRLQCEQEAPRFVCL